MAPTHVLQLTDLHLFADGSGTVNRVPTRRTFIEVLEACRATDLIFDHVILTGDLAQDESRGAYLTLRDLVATLGSPSRLLLIPGNHDSRQFIRDVFPENMPPGGQDDPITFSVGAGAWRLIGLDTQIPGETAGSVDEQQLDWLRQELAADDGAPTIVFMHHPPLPFPTSSVWLERMGLRNQDAVLEILRAAPQVRAISAGHIHQEFSHREGIIDVLTAPSTAYQYKKDGARVVLDPLPPGFRIFRLRDDGYETHVIRLPALNHPAERPGG